MKPVSPLAQSMLSGLHPEFGKGPTTEDGAFQYAEDVLRLNVEQEYLYAVEAIDRLFKQTGKGLFLLCALLCRVSRVSDAVELLLDDTRPALLGRVPARSYAAWVASGRRFCPTVSDIRVDSPIDALAAFRYSFHAGRQAESRSALDGFLDLAPDFCLTEPVSCPDDLRLFYPVRWLERVLLESGRRLLLMGDRRSELLDLVSSYGLTFERTSCTKIKALIQRLKDGDIAGACQAFVVVSAYFSEQNRPFPKDIWSHWSGVVADESEAIDALMLLLQSGLDKKSLVSAYECWIQHVANALKRPLFGVMIHATARLETDCPVAAYRAAQSLYSIGQIDHALVELEHLQGRSGWDHVADRLTHEFVSPAAHSSSGL